MALQSAVGRGNNPFIGGSKTPNAPPTAMGGAIAPANTNVSSPEAGVAPGQPMFARNNRGSNIGIPYTRLVPLGNARFGLDGEPYTEGSDPSIHDHAYGSGGNGLKKNVITETEDLRATRVGFIHGRRKKAGDVQDFERGQDVNGIVNHNYQYMMAPGMPGTERFQKLCSLEYLQRYFAHAFRPGVVAESIQLGALQLPAAMGADGKPKRDAAGANDLSDPTQAEWWKSGLLRMVLRHTDTKAYDAKGVLARVEARFKGSAHAGSVGDIAKAFGLPDSPMLVDSTGGATPTLRQGIFAQDTGPFLRGKGITQEMVRCTQYRDAPQQVDPVGSVERRVQAFHVNRCLGDEVAFDMLEHALEDLGITDWRPDGIVLSKGANDPSDKLSDEAFEVRDGQLYNMRIQGPALSTTWTGDPALEVLPLDKVFIVIVADVWFDGLPNKDKLKNRLKDANEGKELNARVEAVETEEKAGKAARALAVNALAAGNADLATRQQALDAATAAGADPTAAAAAVQTATAALGPLQQAVTDADGKIANAYKVRDAYDGTTPSDAFQTRAAYARARRMVNQAEAAVQKIRARLKPKAAPIDFENATDADIKEAIKLLEDADSQGYMAARQAELDADLVTRNTLSEFIEGGKERYVDGDKAGKTVLTNFRVRTATSSQMINYSPLRFDGNGNQDVDTGGAPDEFRKVYYSSRMGLALTDDMGEYIIGGWCIGNVLDTSASRAVMPGAGSNIGVRTAPNSMAHNINVQIEWWDADRMWRSFCNVQDMDTLPTLTPRHHQSWPQRPDGTNKQELHPKDRPPGVGGSLAEA